MSDPHLFNVRIYFEDTDFSGNVYHASYLKFYERARTEWLRGLGFAHSELAEQGLGFVVRQMNVYFLAPAHIDDMLEITTQLINGHGAQVLLSQEIWRGTEKLNRADVRVVMVNDKGRPTRLPELLRR